MKNQKRKIKDKNRTDADKPPFIDFGTLKSKTVRYLLVSTGLSAFGITTPIFHLVSNTKKLYNRVLMVISFNDIRCDGDTKME